MEMVGRDRQAFTNSLLTLGWNGAWMISTQLGGWMIESRGFALPMLITVGLYFVSSVLYLGFFHGAERRMAAPPLGAR
jgi:hypothetical protein